MRIMLVQYAGDYLEAYNKLENTGHETYYGHRYMLDQLARLSKEFGKAAVLCCKSPQKYNAELPSGVVVIGAGDNSDAQGKVVIQLIADFNPTHLIILGPLSRIIRWGVRAGCKVMCVFADSFEIGPLRRLFRYGRLTPLLNDNRIGVVANHGVNACLSLARIGVKREKIIPWDWVHLRQPNDHLPKTAPDLVKPTLLFVGAVIERKGIGDAIKSIEVLKRRGVSAVLKVAGGGEVAKYKGVAASLGLSAEVEFLGLIPNASVFKLMREATIILVPSQHAYPEGLPLSIYEALCARTPIVASDHPMFRRRLEHQTSAIIYPAGDPISLAGCVEKLLRDPILYRSISAASQKAWEGLQIPTKWGELLFHWIRGDASDHDWLHQRRLDGGLYSL